MLKILDDPHEIETALRFLKDRFISSPFRTIPVTIPYHPNNLDLNVRWFPGHLFWIAFDTDDRIMLGLADKTPERGEKVALTL